MWKRRKKKKEVEDGTCFVIIYCWIIAQACHKMTCLQLFEWQAQRTKSPAVKCKMSTSAASHKTKKYLLEHVVAVAAVIAWKYFNNKFSIPSLPCASLTAQYAASKKKKINSKKHVIAAHYLTLFPFFNTHCTLLPALHSTTLHLTMTLHVYTGCWINSTWKLLSTMTLYMIVCMHIESVHPTHHTSTSFNSTYVLTHKRVPVSHIQQ